MTKRIQYLLGAVLLMIGELAVVNAENCAAIALAVIPQCAQSCFLNGAPTIGCGAVDFACQCASEAKLYAAIEGCVASGCPSPSYQAVIDGASSGELLPRGIPVSPYTDTRYSMRMRNSWLSSRRLNDRVRDDWSHRHSRNSGPWHGGTGNGRTRIIGHYYPCVDHYCPDNAGQQLEANDSCGTDYTGG
jgi:hypothetical protein